jgi:hypothetical protein
MIIYHLHQHNYNYLKIILLLTIIIFSMSSDKELNLEIINNISITCQEINILKNLESFYEDKYNTNIFLKFIDSKINISIRLIDYFITKFSKNNKTNYKLIENNNEYVFNVHSSYKQQLKIYQKKYFDPFSRGDRIPYFLNNTCIITTIGQLNFFKWFISKRIMDYIIENQKNIEIEMNYNNKKDKIKFKNFNMKKYKSNKIIHDVYNNKQINKNNNNKIYVKFF